MSLPYLIAAVAAGALALLLGLYAFARWLQRRKPYADFMRLRTRQKIVFFKRLLTDRRTPWHVKAIPVLLIVYLAIPIDIIPDFIPVLGYLDDVGVVLAAMALVIRLTPRAVIDDLLQELQH